MPSIFTPVLRQSLSDDVAQRISQQIQSAKYEAGARLPSISHMAAQFNVGPPTLREALKKLEGLGIVEIKHGSGVYVGRAPDSLLISNPVFEPTASKKLLVDLIEARIPIELQTAGLAARHATEAHLEEMGHLLANAGRALDDTSLLNQLNLGFHRQVALASGNMVMHQILDVLSSLFRNEQRMILDIHARRADDHKEHLGIYHAIRSRDHALAVRRMRSHLERVRDTLRRWDPLENPVS